MGKGQTATDALETAERRSQAISVALALAGAIVIEAPEVASRYSQSVVVPRELIDRLKRALQNAGIDIDAARKRHNEHRKSIGLRAR